MLCSRMQKYTVCPGILHSRPLVFIGPDSMVVEQSPFAAKVKCSYPTEVSKTYSAKIL